MGKKMKHLVVLGLVTPLTLGVACEDVIGMDNSRDPEIQDANCRSESMTHFADLMAAKSHGSESWSEGFLRVAPGGDTLGAAPALQTMLSQADSAKAIVVEPTVMISDGIIQGRLNARSERGLPLTFAIVGDACGRKCGLGVAGGKITLGTVPLSASTTDPESFTVLLYGESRYDELVLFEDSGSSEESVGERRLG